MSKDFGSALLPMVRKLARWAMFDAADEAATLSLPHRTTKIARNGYIAREGEETTHSCLLLSGFAISHKIVAEGERQILAIHLKGDIVGLQNSMLRLADHAVQVLTDVEVALIPHAAIKQLALKRPVVGMAMWTDTLVDASVFREWVANVGRRNSRTRIAHLLCELAVRLKAAGLGELTDYELPMTQEHIADCTGLTPVHVNRMLKLLENEDLISRRTVRSIRIGDWNRLAKEGDFDGAYLHLLKDKPEFA